MKFNCGPDYAEWKKNRENWHRFFAIFPRRVASHDCRWLEVIERKGTLLGQGSMRPWWRWEYRALHK